MTTPQEGPPPGEAQQQPSPLSPPPEFRLPRAPQGAPPQPPAQYPPPQRPTATADTTSAGAPSAPAAPSAEASLPEVKPARLWYWVFGTIFPVNLLISILLLSDNPGASPALIVSGIVTPILTFFVSLIGCVVVLVIRSAGISRRRAEQTQRARMAASGVPVSPEGIPMPYPGQYIPAAQPGYAPQQPLVARMPPVRIPAKDVRPRRRWMVVGALIFPLSFLLGTTGFWTFGSSAAEASPEFASGVIEGTGSVTFQVSEDQVGSLGLYSTGGLDDENSFTCDLSGASYAGFTERPVGYSHGEWRLVESAVVTSPGTYTLDCSGPSTLEFAIADTDVAVAYDDAMLASVGLMMLSCFVGFILSLTVVITVGVKRGNHRARLIREHQARMYQTRAQGQGQNASRHHPT
ncbi:hypothetical protein [Nocardiopsis metallicus]|uniref:Uncharacterized protein n=1 Tax=Nocardiopsis metallicus TaxID=179819 RepID=A0A840WE27_9ACTN|nr:hypothetical protein [Nocardiopsis metallicus]MBB5494452.1 hypothetical protein [Nocardiopsis metallicus]